LGLKLTVNFFFAKSLGIYAFILFEDHFFLKAKFIYI